MLRKVGIVGSEAAKFTSTTREAAKSLIHNLLGMEENVLVSGRCPLGGIDVWAEEEADALPRPKIIHEPDVEQWNPPNAYGFKARNIDIAKDSDIVHVIVVEQLPPEFAGRRFDACYHCLRAGRDGSGHIKSGACWTLNEALKLGKTGFIHIIRPDGTIVTTIA